MKMEKWKHLTISIKYDGKKHKNWVVEHAEKPPLVGLQAILEAYGSRGWELVSLNPERFQAFPGFARWHIEPRVYRATFKRPVEDQS
jgi:hypothetical protein